MSVDLIPHRVQPRPDVVAWGQPVAGTDLFAAYHADGSLWFAADMLTGRNVRVPVPRPEAEDAVTRLHREANRYDGPVLCYFIGGQRGPIKIGYSVDPESRLRSLQSGSPVKLAILAVEQGGASREAAYHEQFAADRLHGEWFKRTPALTKLIARLTKQIDRRAAAESRGVMANLLEASL